jgi:hypothetical protein
MLQETDDEFLILQSEHQQLIAKCGRLEARVRALEAELAEAEAGALRAGAEGVIS